MISTSQKFEKSINTLWARVAVSSGFNNNCELPMD